MSKEDLIDDLIRKASIAKKSKMVIERAGKLIKSGVERYHAFLIAYYEIVKKNEIH
jgi:hypothetical protein